MKVLCFGNSDGNFLRTLEKVRLLLAKQKFDCLLCLGDLFSASAEDGLVMDVLDNKHSINLPTYFTEGPQGLPPRILEVAAANSGCICDNLYLLGKSGSLKLSDGFKLGYHTSNEFYSQSDSVKLKSNSTQDIFLSKEKDEAEFTTIVTDCQPKYLFYPADTFKEDPPYRLKLPNGDYRLTREIALAPVANPAKSKWFYAFNLTNVPPDAAVVNSADPCPYIPKIVTKEDSSSTKPSADTGPLIDQPAKSAREKRPPSGYVCKLCSVPDDHFFKDCPNKSQSRKRKRGPERVISDFVDPATCFFCLSNPSLARHLIVSIGDAGSYLVLPKGGLTQNHVIILPVDHKPTMKSLEDAREPVENEMNRYVDALEKFYESLNMVGILFEISRSTGVHFHLQMMPIPRDKIEDLTDAFFAFSETEGLKLEKRRLESTDENYFRVFFPSTGTSLVANTEAQKKFDLQFGRRVISDVMGVPERAHWKDCVRTDEQETADAELFKSAFKAFDFSL